MKSPLLRNVWYLALPSKELSKNSKAHRVICGEPIAIVRDSKNQVYALRDICPHRGIPLSYGQVVDDQIECPYHGWKFNRQGVCTEIPSLCPGQDLDSTKIKVRSYPCQEVQGNIWVFVGDKDFDLKMAPPIPRMHWFHENCLPDFTEVAHFPCHIDHAVIGLMDPAHGPYVHRSWFWRSKKSVYEKRKKFAPVEYGFQMVRHQPSNNSRAYKILGGAPTTEITFYLPSVRIEHVLVGQRSFTSFTALTPVDENNTIIHQHAYWNIPWLVLAKPLIKKFAHVFLYQDRDAVIKQQDGLKYEPSLMLIKDADTQAKWYFSLKEAWRVSSEQTSQFKNPVQETVLQWRS